MLSSLLTACSSSSKAVAPTQAQAQQLLDGLAKDVSRHDIDAFAAGLDPDDTALSFRAQERSDLSNLAAVPLASWTYHVASVSTDAATLATVTKQRKAPALIAQVTLSYQLPGVDVVPSTHDLWLTFVTRHGRTYLAGDSDLAASGFASWVGPWRYGKLGVARGAHSIVLGPAGETALLQSLATEVDAAVPQVRSVLGATVPTSRWPGDVAVIVPSSPAEFGALTGSTSSTITDVSAAAVTDGIDPVSGEAFGQRLVLNPSELGMLTSTGRQIVLRHEITHLATATLISAVTPRWLVEGFAEYIGNLGTGQPVATAASELKALVRSGGLPAALPADTSFSATGTALAAVYEESWLACRYIAATAGQAGLVRFYASVGQSIDPAAVAVPAALQSVLHDSVATFTARWRTYVQTQLS